MVPKEKLKLSIWVHPMHFKLKKNDPQIKELWPLKVVRVKQSDKKLSKHIVGYHQTMKHCRVVSSSPIIEMN
jgi:hypothetical protein